jgi:phage gp29-like protein
MTLYDAYGREVDTVRLREEQAAASMAGVRNIYSLMHPSAGLTPEQLAALLRQAELGDPFMYLELAEEMEEKDLHYLAVLGTRKGAVGGLPLTVRAASAESKDVWIADLVRELLLGGTLNLTAALFDVLDAIGKGFSATEITWDTSGHQWMPVRLTWRDPRWFSFDWISGEQLLVRTLPQEGERARLSEQPGEAHFTARTAGNRRAPGVNEWNTPRPFTAPLAPFKFVVHFSKAKSGLPIRGGIARAAGWSYLFKNYVLKDWVTFTEIFGQPLRLGKYGAGATEADKRSLLNAVANIGTDAAAIIPDSMLIEFTEARQTGSADLYERFCEYLDRQTSKAVLGQTLTTELPRGGGSRAAAAVHDEVRRDILAADARRLAETLTRDLVKPVVDLNAGPQKRYPQIELQLPNDKDDAEFVTIVGELADRGLGIAQKTVLDRLGLPLPRAGEALLEAAKTRQN